MGHEPNKIHIYSASWGPTDDGKTVDGPRNATMRAIVKGVNEVRGRIRRENRISLMVVGPKWTWIDFRLGFWRRR